MKKIVLITLTIISLVACDKGPNISTEKIDYLKVQNNTNLEVSIGFFSVFDKVLAIEYIILPNQSIALDSFKSTYFSGGDIHNDCIIDYINPSVQLDSDQFCRVGLWNSEVTKMAYDFGGIKLTELQDSRVVSYAGCDTSGNVPCNIGTVEEIVEKINKKDSKITTTTTYIITNQQFLLADSL